MQPRQCKQQQDHLPDDTADMETWYSDSNGGKVDQCSVDSTQSAKIWQAIDEITSEHKEEQQQYDQEFSWI